ncbi:hypothetical protein PsAD14_01144 [Pseudovibrio sp. Ad14]|nr:hypothetical protein PsW74_05674 [Pseudovibrio sp. W74]KZL11013.1 hypothetical protein PsAD14_01144 [Pseudovibrio sp. Ad14]
MITLNEELLIASGGVRRVYRHPENPKICIKVDARKDGRGAGVTLAEACLFEQLMEQRDQLDFVAISNYRGRIETNFGFGAMFDLITDEITGRPSQILMKMLEDEPQFIETNRFKTALKRFRHDLVQEAVLCRDLRPWNICVQKLEDGDLRLTLIDGVGHARKKWFEHIPLFVQIKMHYYFFSKYIYPGKRLHEFYTKRSSRYSWKPGPMLSKGLDQQKKSDENL